MTPNHPLVSELGADLLTSALVEFMSTADERDSERLRAALHARGLTLSPANPEHALCHADGCSLADIPYRFASCGEASGGGCYPRTTQMKATTELVEVTQEDRDAAVALVARRIDAWGWGPLREIDGLTEHTLAVNAAAEAFAEARALSPSVTQTDRLADEIEEQMLRWENPPSLPLSRDTIQRILAALRTQPAGSVEQVPDDATIAAKARAALGLWLAWPDGPRDGIPEVTNEQVESWLFGLPERLGRQSLQPDIQSLTDAEALGWAKAEAWHHYGIAWEHLEKVSQEELLAQAIRSLRSREG